MEFIPGMPTPEDLAAALDSPIVPPEETAQSDTLLLDIVKELAVLKYMVSQMGNSNMQGPAENPIYVSNQLEF
jgi:hypothetical protein